MRGWTNWSRRLPKRDDVTEFPILMSATCMLSDGRFRYRSRVPFDELDALWVLHHSRYLLHLERAQQALFDTVMETECFDPERYPDVHVVVTHVDIDFLKPIDFVGPFDVLLQVRRVRAAGLVVGFEFRSADGRQLFARGERTVCHLDNETKRPAEWSPQFRERYEALVREGNAG